jgi:exopolysaccharide production protein ExoQ
MTISHSTVMADHVDPRQVLATSWHRIEDAIVCVILAIHTTAIVSLPAKLSGGSFPGLGAVWAIGGILCLIFAAVNLKKTLLAALYGWPILVLTLLIWASYSWTIDPYETMRGAILITCSHLFAFALAGRFSWERIIELVAWTLVTLVGLSIFFAIAMPRVGVMQDIHVGAWAGVWPEKQLLGIFACHGAIATLAMASLGKSRSWLWLFGTALCFLAIIGSTGKTAIIMTVMAISAGVWLRVFHRGVVGTALTAWVSVVCGGIAVLVFSGGLDFLLNALGRSSDFTGRSVVWESAKTLGKMRPMTGWGFQSIWRGKDVMTSPYQWIMDWSGFEPANAHSAWLDIFMQLGLPGLAILALCVGWAWFAVLFLGSKNRLAAGFAGANLMAVTFISFTETNLAGSMDMQWLFVPLLGTKLFYSYMHPDTRKTKTQSSGTLDGDTFTFSS